MQGRQHRKQGRRERKQQQQGVSFFECSQHINLYQHIKMRCNRAVRLCAAF